MDERLARRILDKAKKVPQSPVSRMIGKVTETEPLTVTIGGVEHEYLRADSCAPRVNDRVWVERTGSEPPLVIGTITDDDEVTVAANSGGNWSATQPIIARVICGRIFLDGTAARSSGTNGTICTLPSGYRPPYTTSFAVATFGAVGLITVWNTGAVSFVSGTAAAVYLDGTNFPRA